MQRKCVVFFFKQKTAYEMRISDWSSDVCSSDLPDALRTELVAVGERRGSLVEEELEVGLRSLAVPVRDREGQVLAALNVATFSDAHSREDLIERYLPDLRAAAGQLERAIQSHRPNP